MILAQSPFAILAAQLDRKVQALARARTKAATLKRHDDARHWRDARLVWPLFGEG